MEAMAKNGKKRKVVEKEEWKMNEKTIKSLMQGTLNISYLALGIMAGGSIADNPKAFFTGLVVLMVDTLLFMVLDWKLNRIGGGK